VISCGDGADLFVPAFVFEEEAEEEEAEEEEEDEEGCLHCYHTFTLSHTLSRTHLRTLSHTLSFFLFRSGCGTFETHVHLWGVEGGIHL
jgi:hypothetical protein